MWNYYHKFVPETKAFIYNKFSLFDKLKFNIGDPQLDAIRNELNIISELLTTVFPELTIKECGKLLAFIFQKEKEKNNE